MPNTKALAVLHILIESEKAFKANKRELGWQLLEQAEQSIPSIEDGELFRSAQGHADRLWSEAIDADVKITRGESLSLELV